MWAIRNYCTYFFRRGYVAISVHFPLAPRLRRARSRDLLSNIDIAYDEFSRGLPFRSQQLYHGRSPPHLTQGAINAQALLQHLLQLRPAYPLDTPFLLPLGELFAELMDNSVGA